MQWIRQGGTEALKALADVGEAPGSEDLPPLLQWEAPLWSLYAKLQRQWRWREKAAMGLDMNVFLPVIQSRGWDLDLSLDLLATIEDAFLATAPQHDEPESET